jgi:MFS family permease
MSPSAFVARTLEMAGGLPSLDPGRTEARLGLMRLCAAGFVAYCSYAICRPPLLPLLARELGAGAPLVGFIVGASTLTGVLLKLPAGALSDVFGRSRLLVGGAFVFAALPFAYLAASTLFMLVVLRFAHGLASAIFGPVTSASLSDIAPPGQRGMWLSTYSAAQGAGLMVGPVLAGYLIPSGRFDLAFAVAGVIGIGVPLILAGWHAPSQATAHGAPWQEVRRGLAEVWHDRLVLITSGAQAAQYVLNGALSAFLPLYGYEVLGLTAAQLGWLFAVQTLTTLAVRPVIGFVSDRVGRRWIIVTGLTVCGAAVLVVSMATSMTATVAAILLYAVGLATTTAATSAYVTDVSRRTRYGVAHGVFGTIYDAGDALGPIVAGLLVPLVGYVRMFQVMALVTLVMAAAFIVMSMAPASDRGIDP